MDRRPARAITGLGMATIVAYGTWFYAYGVLIDPVAAETGWSVGFLSTVYGAAQLTGSILAVVMATASYPREKMAEHLAVFAARFAQYCAATCVHWAVLGVAE